MSISSVRETEKTIEMIRRRGKMFVYLRSASKPHLLTIAAEQIISGEIELAPTGDDNKALIEITKWPYSFRVKRLKLNPDELKKTADWAEKNIKLPKSAKELPITEIVFEENDCVFKTNAGSVSIPWDKILTGTHCLQITSFSNQDYVVFMPGGQPLIRIRQSYFNAIADRARENNISKEEQCSLPI